MEKTPDGIVVADHHLPQQPTLAEMTEYELNFAFTIDDLLSRIKKPEYRQLMVEVTTCTILYFDGTKTANVFVFFRPLWSFL